MNFITCQSLSYITSIFIHICMFTLGMFGAYLKLTLYKYANVDVSNIVHNWHSSPA